jgi:hypothetical protein
MIYYLKYSKTKRNSSIHLGILTKKSVQKNFIDDEEILQVHLDAF